VARYCRHCGERGHNKRTCPHITADYENDFFGYKEHGEDYFELYGKPNDYYTGRREHYRELVIQRSGIDPETGEQVSKELQKALARKKMKCSYCQQRGHTRRTCRYLKEDIQVKRRALSKFRQKTQEMFTQTRINLGTLIVLKDKDYNPDTRDWVDVTHTYMVTAFDWEKTSYTNNVGAACFIRAEPIGTINSLPPHYTRHGKRHLSLNQLCESESFSRYAIVEVHTCSKGVKAPQNWLDGGDHPSNSTRTLKDDCFPVGQIRATSYEIYAYRDPDHPLYQARKELGLCMVMEY
jgi:hypothetical protein